MTPMSRHSAKRSHHSLTSLVVLGSLSLSQTGCLVSSTEAVSTDKVFLLGPKTESVPGPTTRDVTMRAVDTRGSLVFHVDRARECTVTSTPRYQKVHVEGKQGKNIGAGILTGAILTAAAGGLLAGSFLLDNGEWTRPASTGSSENEFTGAGLLGIAGIIVGITGLVVLPRGLYHAAVSGTTVTPGDVQAGKPPPGAVLAPKGYDPKDPQVGFLKGPGGSIGFRNGAVLPLIAAPTAPAYDVFSFGAMPAGQLPSDFATKTAPLESLRSGRIFNETVASMEDCEAPFDPSFLAMPQASGGGSGSASDQMKACVAKYTPSCQSKCGTNKPCILECLRKPCVENLDKEIEDGSGGSLDENVDIIAKKEVCERSPETGLAIAIVTKDLDGVPKTIDLGKTDKNGDITKDVLAGLESVYAGWPDIKQVILEDAKVVLVEDPTVELGKLNLAKYPGLKYAEHVQSTRKAREAMAAAEAAKKEKEAKERQAMLEAAAKAEDDALHADERKAEAAKKAQQCASSHQAKCNSECQGNSSCVKKCMQKMPLCK